MYQQRELAFAEIEEPSQADGQDQVVAEDNAAQKKAAGHGDVRNDAPFLILIKSGHHERPEFPQDERQRDDKSSIDADLEDGHERLGDRHRNQLLSRVRGAVQRVHQYRKHVLLLDEGPDAAHGHDHAGGGEALAQLAKMPHEGHRFFAVGAHPTLAKPLGTTCQSTASLPAHPEV